VRRKGGREGGMGLGWGGDGMGYMCLLERKRRRREGLSFRHVGSDRLCLSVVDFPTTYGKVGRRIPSPVDKKASLCYGLELFFFMCL